MAIERLDFAIEEWTDDGQHVLEVHGRVRSLTAAYAVFDLLVSEKRHSHLTLRSGARVIRESAPATSG